MALNVEQRHEFLVARYNMHPNKRTVLLTEIYSAVYFLLSQNRPCHEAIKAKRDGHGGIVTKLIKEAAPLLMEGFERMLIRLRTINHQLDNKLNASAES